MRAPRWVFPTLSGCLFAAGWWLCADAVARQNRYGYLPPPGPSWYLPGTIATLGAFMTAMAPGALHDEDHGMATFHARGPVSWSRCWVFLSFLVSMGALVAGVAVSLSMVAFRDELAQATGVVERATAAFALEGPVVWEGPRETPGDGGVGEDEDPWEAAKERHFSVSVWPGVAVTIQSALILCASFAWIAAVKCRNDAENEDEW